MNQTSRALHEKYENCNPYIRRMNVTVQWLFGHPSANSWMWKSILQGFEFPLSELAMQTRNTTVFKGSAFQHDSASHATFWQGYITLIDPQILLKHVSGVVVSAIEEATASSAIYHSLTVLNPPSPSPLPQQPPFNNPHSTTPRSPYCSHQAPKSLLPSPSSQP